VTLTDTEAKSLFVSLLKKPQGDPAVNYDTDVTTVGFFESVTLDGAAKGSLKWQKGEDEGTCDIDMTLAAEAEINRQCGRGHHAVNRRADRESWPATDAVDARGALIVPQRARNQDLEAAEELKETGGPELAANA